MKDDPAQILTERIDLKKNIGAYGHSLGGRLCGALAAEDRRVSAFVAMEGVAPPKARRGGIKAASLMLYSSELPEDMALPNIREIYDERIAPAAILRLEGFGHNSVTDRPLLFPDSFNHEVDPKRGLVVTRDVLRTFFSAYMRGEGFDPADLARQAEVTIVEFSASAGND